MSQDKLKVFKKYLKENLNKGFIRASYSSDTNPTKKLPTEYYDFLNVFPKLI